MDPHWGPISEWQALIDEIHSRNMYIIMDFTVSTMADFIGFKGYVFLLALHIRRLSDPQFQPSE